MTYDKEIEEIIKEKLRITGHTYDDTLKIHCETIARQFNKELETKIIKEILMNSSLNIVNDAIGEYSKELEKVTNNMVIPLYTTLVIEKGLSLNEIKETLEIDGDE